MTEIDSRFEDHHNAALRLLTSAMECDETTPSTLQRNMIAAAQVHAALAHAVAVDRLRRESAPGAQAYYP